MNYANMGLIQGMYPGSHGPAMFQSPLQMANFMNPVSLA